MNVAQVRAPGSETASRGELDNAVTGVPSSGVGRRGEVSAFTGEQLDAVERFTDSVAFPAITFAEFKKLPLSMRSSIIARNRIVNTDTYNRTMGHLIGELFKSAETTTLGQAKSSQMGGAPATFTLQMRRSPFEYLVVAGVQDMVDELTTLPISKAELDFAKEYYKETKVPFFNEGMWRSIVEENGGKLPIEINGMRDGSIVLPSEPLLTVKGPEELVAHFEHVFHRLFYPTLVATRAQALLNIIEDPRRFIEVGKRGAITEQQHHQALRAMEIGGEFTLTSNDCGLGISELSDVGTIGHRYVQRFPTEEKAFRHAIENLPAVTLLVDLIDTYRGIDLSLKLKEEYRETGKKIWVRLDSGDIKDQVRYFLTKSQEQGMTDPVLDRVVVEGVESIEEIADIEKMIIQEFGHEARKRVVYGAGGLLISEQVSRKDASTGYKLSQYTDISGEEESTLKKSNSPGKESLPGEPRLAIVDGKRVVVQPGEEIAGDVIHLFEPLLVDGINCCYAEEVEEAKARRRIHEKLLDLGALSGTQRKGLRARPSPETQVLIDAVCAKYEMSLEA